MYDGEDGGRRWWAVLFVFTHLDFVDHEMVGVRSVPGAATNDLSSRARVASPGQYEDDSPTKRKMHSHLFAILPEGPAMAKLPAHSPSISSLLA
ncbi:hypothetical protein Hypma_002255 [Hypsizygus marmoreus]|uniref:Uncharacterized protein n=1 Tax=Hypsizygus marmoreus TaxID=39966 RepID=A0A369JZU8_HYPMA|nr:hypothetical protein Hypma_002255 [Hypsizygus marmoreus]